MAITNYLHSIDGRADELDGYALTLMHHAGAAETELVMSDVVDGPSFALHTAVASYICRRRLFR